jgi:hypothetical protein
MIPIQQTYSYAEVQQQLGMMQPVALAPAPAPAQPATTEPKSGIDTQQLLKHANTVA